MKLFDPKASGMPLMLLAMGLFACLDGINKTLTMDYAVVQILWIRYVVFTALTLVVAARSGTLARAIRPRRPGLQILRSTASLAEVGLFIAAFRVLPLADAHAIAAAKPLIVTALSVPLLGEAVGLRRWTAVAIGFVGVLVIVRPGLGVLDPAILLAMAGASALALYDILTRRAGVEDQPESTMLFTPLVGLVVTSFLVPGVWITPDGTGSVLFLLGATLGTVGHLLLIGALRRSPAASLQPLFYSLFLGAIIVGFVVFGDFPDAFTLIGAAIIVTSGLYTLYRERVRKGDEGVEDPQAV